MPINFHVQCAAFAALLCLGPTAAGAESNVAAGEATILSWEWKRMGELASARELPRLVPLRDGRLMIIGGGSTLRATAVATTEILDEKASSWKAGPQLTEPRRDPEAIRFRDGAILVIGGSNGPFNQGTRTAEMIDSDASNSRPVAQMHFPRIGHTATLISDNEVLVVGGQSDPSTCLE